MHINQLIILFSVSLFICQAFGQHSISGVVTDVKDNVPLIGVNIIVKDGVGLGTITDVDGRYTLNLPDGNGILIFSYIGYDAQEIAIEGRNLIEVSLSNDTKSSSNNRTRH